MLRTAVLAFTVLAACEQSATRPTTPRAKLDTHALPFKLPARGYAVQTSGVGGAYDAELVDLEARTLRVVVHPDGRPDREQTIALDAAQLKRLEDLADRAWREQPQGKARDAMDIMQDLFIVDQDDAFFVRGYPIYSIGGTSNRAAASELVLAILELAQPALAEPAAAPIAKAPATRHAHAIDRKSLATPHTDPKFLPLHGIAVHTWGLGGDVLIVLDRDAATLRTVSHLMGKKPSDRTRKLAAATVEELMTAAFAAWHEDPTGPTPEATDVREDLIVLDGDEAFYLMGHPISTFTADEQTGRPAAARAMSAIFGAAK